MARKIENPNKLILKTAKDILYNDGYEKLSMRNVAVACDIGLGTIYNYYPTKKDLVVEMMADYWSEYLFRAQEIVNLDYMFYEKLKKLFDDLSNFINIFKKIWLKPEIYDNPDYVKDGAAKEDIYMEKLVLLIENILIKDNKVNDKISSYETSKFIVMNFITIIQMPVFKYSDFEIILKELLD